MPNTATLTDHAKQSYWQWHFMIPWGDLPPSNGRMWSKVKVNRDHMTSLGILLYTVKEKMKASPMRATVGRGMSAQDPLVLKILAVTCCHIPSTVEVTNLPETLLSILSWRSSKRARRLRRLPSCQTWRFWCPATCAFASGKLQQWSLCWCSMLLLSSLTMQIFLFVSSVSILQHMERREETLETTPLRNSYQFQNYFRQVWKLLNETVLTGWHPNRLPWLFIDVWWCFVTFWNRPLTTIWSTPWLAPIVHHTPWFNMMWCANIRCCTFIYSVENKGI